MDSEKIGQFIQKLRKEKHMTQQELADFLHVTDRAVSYWENGRSIPDISLFQPICEIFDISVNELIRGEKITKDQYREKSDENILHTLNDHKKHQERSRIIIMLLVIGMVVLFLIALFGIRDNYPKINLFHFTIQSADSEKPYVLDKKITIQDRDIYYYGLDFAIFCEEDEKCYSVDDAFQHKQITLEEFQKYLEKQAEYGNYEIMRFYDGGTTVYQKNGIQVMYCHTIDGNQDVYIGNDQMLSNLHGEYCGHLRDEDESYIRTYKVLRSSIDSKDSEFNLVTLEQNNGSTGMVSISNSFSLVPGHTYEFSFLTFDLFDDTIENIFEYSTLLKVVETDKDVSMQVNEAIIVNQELDNGAELNELEHVRMDIIEGTLTKTSARIRITDFSGGLYSYDAGYRIDQRVNDEWVELVPKEDMVINAIAYKPDINGHVELSMNWERFYGKLDHGTYRIVKSATKDGEACRKDGCKQYYFSVVFDI